MLKHLAPTAAAALGLNATSLSAAPAVPHCEARFDTVAIQGQAQYEPLSGQDLVLPVEVKVRRPEACALALEFAGQPPLSGPEGPLEYRIQAAGGRVLRGGDIAAIESGGYGDASFNVFVVVPAGQLLQPGSYRSRLRLRLGEGGHALDEREVELDVAVRSQAKIAFAAGGFSRSGFDFGELETGERREGLLFVRSNGAYLLKLSSENRGALRLRGAGGAEVPYRANLDGVALDLSRPATVAARPRDSLRGRGLGRPWRLAVEIGDVSGREAGDYQDLLTVEVTLLD